MRNTTNTKLDTAGQAVLIASIAKAAKLGLCPMCAGERKVESHEGTEYIVCQHCRDAVPVTAEPCTPVNR